MVSRYALSFGRKAGYWVSLGIAVGIIIHVTYSLIGVAVIIHQNEWVYLSLLMLGALYLGYIGLGAITAKPRGSVGDDADSVSLPRKRKAFSVGFLTNGLNVKATLFFSPCLPRSSARQRRLPVKAGLWYLPDRCDRCLVCVFNLVTDATEGV